MGASFSLQLAKSEVALPQSWLLRLNGVLDASQHQGVTTGTRQDGALKDVLAVSPDRNDEVLRPVLSTDA